MAVGLLACPMYSAIGLRISSIWKMRWGMAQELPAQVDQVVVVDVGCSITSVGRLPKFTAP